MSQYQPVFVGRENELKQVFDFLDEPLRSALMVFGETGIGKTSFLNEVVKQIKKDDSSKRFVVGHHKVGYGTLDVSTPFVKLIEDMLSNMNVSFREKIQEHSKRIRSVCEKLFAEKGKRFVKSIAKFIALKYLGKEAVEELEKTYKEFQKTPTVTSIAKEIISRYKGEFMDDMLFLIRKLVEEYENIDYVWVIDQFERARKDSYDILLGIIEKKPERVHIIVSFELVEESAAKYYKIKQRLLREHAQFLTLPPLSQEEIGIWITRAAKREFSVDELKLIKQLSGGFPFVINYWLKFSRELEFDKLKEGRDQCCESLRWCFDGLHKECYRLLRQLSVLHQPLSTGEYGQLAGVETCDCSIMLENLEKKWVLEEQEEDIFWFRHDLVKSCLERKLGGEEKKKYHRYAADFYETEYRSKNEKQQSGSKGLLLGLAYHSHEAKDYEKSLAYNSRIKDYLRNIGALDYAEDCYLRAIHAAKKLGKKTKATELNTDLATHVYENWGRLDEARSIYVKSLNYYRKVGKKKAMQRILVKLANIDISLENFDSAEKLFRKSLKNSLAIGDKEIILESKRGLGLVRRQKEKFDSTKEFLNEILEVEPKFKNMKGISKTISELDECPKDKADLKMAVEDFFNNAHKLNQEGSPSREIAVEKTAKAIVHFGGIKTGELRSRIYIDELKSFRRFYDTI